jgi:hypothetical protein
MINRARWLALGGWLALSGCVGSKPKPAGAASDKVELGRTAESPVVTCGPGDSYAYIAQRFRCADGKNPFGGDSKRAAASRRGSMAAPQGIHMIDIYDVPCSAGKTAVYVDMYGCPEYEQMLTEVRDAAGGSRELQAAFQQGQYDAVLQRCESLAPDAPQDAQVWRATRTRSRRWPTPARGFDPPARRTKGAPRSWPSRWSRSTPP